MMQSLLALPESAPFEAADIAALECVVGKSTPEQRAWLSGFLAGVDAANAPPQAAAASAPQERIPLTILYASDSGNAESLALAAKAAAGKQGFAARVHDMADISVAEAAKAKNLIVYAATWGEGDPPERAAEFYAALMADDAPRFDGVAFSVLALGDSAYVNYCETGRQIDARLEALGGARTRDRVELDLDFAAHAPAWTEATLAALKPAEAEPAAQPKGAVVHVDFAAAPAFSQTAPFEAEIASAINLSGTGSTRETWHVELQTDAPGFVYAPGDSIGIVAENDPELVERLMDAAKIGDDPGLADRLKTGRDVTTLSRLVAEKYAARVGRADVAALAADADAFNAYAADRQLVDLLIDFPERLAAEDLEALLRPLPPRYYSVASSPAAHPGETHLLVGAVRWTSYGIDRKGVASTYMADRVGVGDRLKAFVKPNRRFRLPEDTDRPIVMIGAGTGVAPYRGFVAEREATGAQGKNWLVFGERNYTHDFLYQLEWQAHLASGALSRIDVAFSRDQDRKIYVQDRLWERRDALAGWIADGAHLYVCGDEKRMAKDVDAMLVRILAERAGGDLDAGRAELAGLAKSGRYQRDIY